MLMIVLGLATFVFTLAGGAVAIKFKRLLPFFFAFASGSLIAVSFFDILPESINIAESVNLPIKYVMLTIVLSFLLYSLIEKFFMTHHHHEDEGHGHVMGPIGAGSLCVHSLLDGAAIGAAFAVNPAVGLVVAFAVLSHDFTDGINTVTLMLKNNHKIKHATLFLILDAIAPIIGILITSAFTIKPAVLALILAFFVGEFLYIGAANLLPETHKHHSKWITFSMLFGAALIFIITSII